MKTYTDLLPHQAEAVKKLKKIKVGALYMEMGTGKTRTALELIAQRLNAGKVDHVVWLCPCSIKGDIARGIAEHSDLADTGLLDVVGIETLSTSVRECSRLLELAQSRRVYLVVDESSLIKNHKALRSEHISQIAGKCNYKMILSGTPITRSEEDLYGQWKILDWRILGYRSFYSFAANHLEYDKKGRVRNTLNTDYLAEKIEPYTYQVLKSECLVLPEKHRKTRPFLMTDEQDVHYSWVIDRLLTDLDEMTSEAIYRLFGALQSVISGYRIDIDHKLRTSREMMFDNPEDNPRVKCLLRALQDFEDEKILIFCRFTDEILILHRILSDRGIPCAAFYGGMRQKDRELALDDFRGPARILLANKACGAHGLNLQFCRNIIFYSHDWDWGTRAQAEDRVHRIGQTEDVNILDIECANSIDVKILECLKRKGNLSDEFKRNIRLVQKEELLKAVRGGNNAKTIPEQNGA